MVGNSKFIILSLLKDRNFHQNEAKVKLKVLRIVPRGVEFPKLGTELWWSCLEIKWVYFEYQIFFQDEHL